MTLLKDNIVSINGMLLQYESDISKILYGCDIKNNRWVRVELNFMIDDRGNLMSEAPAFYQEIG